MRAEFRIERATIQPGRTISKEALDNLGAQVQAFAAAAIQERWQQTGEPPTLLVVKVEAEAS